MCRNIRPLYNYDPPASPADIEAAALQFVRKVSGYRTPPHTNTPAFDLAVDEIAQATEKLLGSLKHRRRTAAGEGD